MQISTYSTISFDKSRNLLTERQKNIKAFNPIVPQGGCISLLEINPLQYLSIRWTLINEKTKKETTTTAESSDSMHYVAIPEGLQLGTYTLKIVTTWTDDEILVVETTISNPFEYVKASGDIVTIVSRNLENDLVGNLPPNATVIQPIYVNPLKIVELADVDDTDIAIGKILKVGSDGVTHEYADESGGIPEAPIDGNQYVRKDAEWVAVSGGLDKTFQTLTDAATITFDAADSVNGTVTLTASREIDNITNAVLGEIHTIRVIQGGTGSYALTFGNQYYFPGNVRPSLSASVGAVDVFQFIAVSETRFELTNFLPDQKNA